jgi:hypothetical protein
MLRHSAALLRMCGTPLIKQTHASAAILVLLGCVAIVFCTAVCQQALHMHTVCTVHSALEYICPGGIAECIWSATGSVCSHVCGATASKGWCMPACDGVRLWAHFGEVACVQLGSLCPDVH